MRSDLRISVPRGTSDILGTVADFGAALQERAGAILQGGGYRRIETPTFESTELFARGVGESTDIVQKEMYTFTDPGGRSLTLRPEGTAPVCRAYVEHGMHKLRQPVKLWYLSSFFRHERAQAGRYRQFWQVGAEALGSQDPAVDAESIVLLGAILEEMGVTGVRLRLSSLGAVESRLEYRQHLQDYLRANEDRLSPEVVARVEVNPLRAFDSADPRTREVMEGAPRLLDHLGKEDSEHFAEVRGLLDEAGVTYEVDSSLVRGLDYYTRTVFEFTSDRLGAQSGVGGGGRYDGLVERLGGPAGTGGIGWAAGVERMMLAGDPVTHRAEPAIDLFIALDRGSEGVRLVQRRVGFAILSQSRSAGLTARMELGGRSIKSQLRDASQIGVRYLAIVGRDGEVVLNDIDLGTTQGGMGSDQVVHAVLRGLHGLT